MAIITYGGIRVGQTMGSNPAIGAWILANIRPHELFTTARLNWPGSFANAPILEQTQPPWQYVVIDSLWWPWGASRFARAHVVIGEKNLNLIRQQVYANQGYQPLPFVIDDEFYSTPITTKLWMLPARPLSQAATVAQGGESLYLLTLVDDRYFWWESSLHYDVSEGVTQWTDIYASIGLALGVSITNDPIPTIYGTPVDEYSAAYRPTPTVLDAVAFSVGQRIVRGFDGTVKAQNALTALANQTTQLALFKGRRRRGGSFDIGTQTPTDLSALVPATIEAVYLASGPGSPLSGLWPVTTTLSALNLSQIPQPLVGGQPWTKVLHRYEPATFNGAVPTNQAALLSLTQQAATDWLLWQLGNLDEWFARTMPWKPDGLSDLEFRQVNGEITTHVQRGVFNTMEDLLHTPLQTFVPPECIDIQTDEEQQRRCENGIDNLYTRTVIYNCGVKQFPLPPWTFAGQVGCCACVGTSGSGVVGCCPPTASQYFCVCFPMAKCTIPGTCQTCQDPAIGVTLIRNDNTCVWDNVTTIIGTGGSGSGFIRYPDGLSGAPVQCGNRSYTFTFTACDSDLCGDANLNLVIYQYTSGVFTGKAVYTGQIFSWNCKSVVVLKLILDTMTGPDDLGITVTPYVTLFPEQGPCCAASGSGTGSGQSGSGSGAPFWCVQVIAGGGGGGGTIPCVTCPSVLLSSSMTLVITNGGACNGTYTLTWNPSFNNWNNGISTLGTCTNSNPNDWTLEVLCSSAGVFGLGGAISVIAILTSNVTCGPPTFTAVFSNVDTTACGGSSNATVTVTGTSGTGGSGGASGSGSASYVCISQNKITGGNISIGGLVEWGGGQQGVIVAGPWADPTCGNSCPAPSGSGIINSCCGNLGHVLHVTFGGAFAGLGSVPFFSKFGSLTGPWYADRIITTCGTGNLTLTCDAQTGTWILEGFLGYTGPHGGACNIEIVAANGFTQSCTGLIIATVFANPGGGVPGQGTIIYNGDCTPGLCQGQLVGSISL